MSLTRIELPPPPDYVLAVLTRLQQAGGRGWIVGGAVRDWLLGGAPDDFDLVTDLPPQTVADAFARVDRREAELGTVRVAVDGQEVTVTTLREERGYSDRRHPDEVQFVTDPARDALRRDFRINALYFDPLRGELLDPLGGREDLDARRLQVIGDAETRLAEDPLRLLRMVRFACRYELQLDDALQAATRRVAPTLASLSSERIFAELTATFVAPGRGRALRLLVDLGIADVILPEVSPMDGVEQPPEYHPEGDVLTHVCLVLDHCLPNDPVQAWSAVLHDVGKPKTFRRARDRIRFDGHDNVSADMADAALQRLRAPRLLRQRVEDVCRQHIRFAALPQMRPVRAERWLRQEHFRDHLEFHRADCLGSHEKLEIYRFARDKLEQLPEPSDPLLTGKDVLALAVPPGPEIGQILRSIEDRLAEESVPPTRQRALILLRDAVAQRRQG
ncbi:MAG: CCA tRNA nucleotidyltransferase [Planctomycetota bacterium]